jgi:hypothetical protein
MSKPELKVVEAGEQAAAQRQDSPVQADEFTEELPPLHIDPRSFDARIAGIENCSVARELAKHWASVTAFEIKQEAARREGQGESPLSDAEEDKRFRERWLEHCTKRHPNPDEFVEFIKRKASRFISWGDVGTMWRESPAEAIGLWRALRLEARDEFFSGHYGARAFEVMSYQHEAWRRAQYLAIRDGLIEEWMPRGASEMILIDTMTQTYVMQLEWTEKAMIRFHGEPRMESWEFQNWKSQRRVEAKYNQWGPGSWDIPYQHEAEAVEQAFRMADLCQKTFQRALRQLANVRLVRAKTNRMKRRERVRTIKAIKVA